MKLHTFDAPTELNDLKLWIESFVASASLGDLVAEMQAAAPDIDLPTPDVEEVIGDDLPAVLAGGMNSLGDVKFEKLISNPALLLDLQELILVDGGKYWDEAFGKSGNDEWSAVRDRLGERSEFVRREAVVAKWNFSQIAIYALAAVLLIGLAVTVNRMITPNRVKPWGWQRVASSSSTRSEYLSSLAQSANDWFAVRPQSKSDARLRIEEFISGCDNLIQSNHIALSKEDSAWLVDKCRRWKGELEEGLSDLDSRPLSESLASVDLLVNALVRALRDRALSSDQDNV